MIDNRSDYISAEGRPYLKQQILVELFIFYSFVVADLQIGAVSGKARLGCTCNSGRQVPAGDSRSIKYNLRLMLMD